MRITLKVNNENPDNSLYIIELQHHELGDVAVALLNDFTKDSAHSIVLATLMTSLPPTSLQEFFTAFKAQLHPTKAASTNFALMRALFMHRAELCATLPPNYEPKS